MTTLQISANAYMLFIPNTEVKTSLDNFDIHAAKAAVEEAIPFPACDRLCLEVFTANDGVIIFAKLLTGHEKHFAFPDFESIIAVSRLCPDSLLTSLTYLEGEYIVTVFPENSELPPPALSEFGNELEVSPFFSAHLSEYGREVIPFQALSTINSTF